MFIFTGSSQLEGRAICLVKCQDLMLCLSVPQRPAGGAAAHKTCSRPSTELVTASHTSIHPVNPCIGSVETSSLRMSSLISCVVSGSTLSRLYGRHSAGVRVARAFAFPNRVRSTHVLPDRQCADETSTKRHVHPLTTESGVFYSLPYLLARFRPLLFLLLSTSDLARPSPYPHLDNPLSTLVSLNTALAVYILSS